jgi:DNA-binding transcriptional ArsR family regulator
MEPEPQKTDELGYLDVSPFVRLFSKSGRVKILDVFLRQPHTELSVSEVAEVADISPSTFHRNIDTIKELGVVKESEERSGTVYYELNTENPVAQILGETHQELIRYQKEVLESTDSTESNIQSQAIGEAGKYDDDTGSNDFKVPADKVFE